MRTSLRSAEVSIKQAGATASPSQTPDHDNRGGRPENPDTRSPRKIKQGYLTACKSQVYLRFKQEGVAFAAGSSAGETKEAVSAGGLLYTLNVTCQTESLASCNNFEYTEVFKVHSISGTGKSNQYQGHLPFGTQILHKNDGMSTVGVTHVFL